MTIPKWTIGPCPTLTGSLVGKHMEQQILNECWRSALDHHAHYILSAYVSGYSAPPSFTNISRHKIDHDSSFVYGRMVELRNWISGSACKGQWGGWDEATQTMTRWSSFSQLALAAFRRTSFTPLTARSNCSHLHIEELRACLEKLQWLNVTKDAGSVAHAYTGDTSPVGGDYSACWTYWRTHGWGMYLVSVGSPYPSGCKANYTKFTSPPNSFPRVARLTGSSMGWDTRRSFSCVLRRPAPREVIVNYRIKNSSPQSGTEAVFYYAQSAYPTSPVTAHYDWPDWIESCRCTIPPSSGWRDLDAVTIYKCVKYSFLPDQTSAAIQTRTSPVSAPTVFPPWTPPAPPLAPGLRGQEVAYAPADVWERGNYIYSTV